VQLRHKRHMLQSLSHFLVPYIGALLWSTIEVCTMLQSRPAPPCAMVFGTSFCHSVNCLAFCAQLSGREASYVCTYTQLLVHFVCMECHAITGCMACATSASCPKVCSSNLLSWLGTHSPSPSCTYCYSFTIFFANHMHCTAKLIQLLTVSITLTSLVE
jgi:hypothetical protein